MSNLQGKFIVLGVTASIAAYKAAFLASQLYQAGAQVQVAMTREALAFVGPLTFESLTHRRVATDVLALGPDSEIEHVTLARLADLMLIAPATANMLAKLAHGLADDAVSATALDLFSRAPLIVAPAMETRMWDHPATQENVETLRRRGAVIVEPEEGHLASGARGKGRLADLEQILATVRQVLGRKGDLSGHRLIITAGGTQEAIDPVRVIANLSSGKMGLVLAEAARDRGAQVTLIAGALRAALPAGIETVHVLSAAEMREQVLARAAEADALIMAAAVADFRPAHPVEHKIKKEEWADLSIPLVRNPDILADVASGAAGGRPRVVVGFAAETSDLLANAQKKLVAKHLDLIVANPVPQTFGSDLVQAVLLDGQTPQELAPMTKEELAEMILNRVSSLLHNGVSAAG